MIGLHTPLTQTETLKRFLQDKGILNKNYKLIRRTNSVYIPLLKISAKEKTELLRKFSDIEFTDTKFEKIRKKQNYKNLLKDSLSELDLLSLPSSFDIVGSILILDIRPGLEKYEKQIAEALLQTNKAIRTILKKSGIHEGEFRTQKLKYIAGERTKETIYRENNVRLKLDVEKVYFSPRLSTERKRIYRQIKKGESVLVMFSGCGPYPLVLSKNTEAKKIIGIEKNPTAHRYAVENLILNKAKNVELIKGDVRDVIPNIGLTFDRIIMPLPKDADTFLDVAFIAAKSGTIIHLYDFEHESELDKGKEKVLEAAGKNKVNCKILRTVKCGQYSPGKFRICVDFRIE